MLFRRIIRWLAVAGLVLAWPTQGAAAVTSPIRVVVSFSILQDIVQEVGGGDVAVTSLIGPDSDAHVFEPRPDQARLRQLRTVGLHPYDRPGHIFSLLDCHVTDFRLMTLWRELRAHLELLPPRLTGLTLRLDRDGRRHVIAESPGEPWQTAERLRAALPDATEVVCWWQPAKGVARVVAGPSTGFQAVAFEPENPEMGMLACRWAVEQLGELRRQVTWDLYGGIGDTAAFLAERGAEVVSVDADERAIAWASRRGLPESVRFIAGRAEDVLATLPPPHAVVVSPPAAGLHWDVILRFTGEPVARLVYISGDPATLARDLRRLSVTYRLTAIKAFDLFPQTARVATVVALEAA